MKKFKFLTGVIFLISVFVLVGLVGKAHAWVGWWGFSSLCYEAKLKGSPDTELKIDVVNLTVQTGCINLMDSSVDCKAGVGNSGSFIIKDYPETSAGSDKTQGIVTIGGCIDLSKYDGHYDSSGNAFPSCEGSNDGVCHTHTCQPLTNPNKVEIAGSAYVSSLEVYYDVINLKNNQIKYSAHQICSWTGTINADTCLPNHDGTAPGGAYYFDCSEEQIIK